MAEYIEKAALMGLIQSEARRWGDDYDWWQCLSDIEDFKPADVCPIIRGNWIYSYEPYPGQNPYGHYECDVCFESVPHPTRYCPKCGAFMKGRE